MLKYVLPYYWTGISLEDGVHLQPWRLTFPRLEGLSILSLYTSLVLHLPGGGIVGLVLLVGAGARLLQHSLQLDLGFT